jgi:tetratricopeptide (TPR) repeat protein
MKRPKKKIGDYEGLSLSELCARIVSFGVPFEEVGEWLENKTYALCADGKCRSATRQLGRLVEFFESKKTKNEDERRELADICILTGEVNQYIGAFKESIKWFWRAAAAYGGYAVPFHNLATSFIELGDLKNAVASLEREIALEPGNYFSRLRLAELYEQRGMPGKVEECLESLLSRNPDNIQALHKLITHYENQRPAVNVKLLRRRLLSVTRKFSELEMVIVVYHLCREEQFDKALRFLDLKLGENPAMTMLHLLKAHVFGRLRRFSMKRRELAQFKNHCYGKAEYMQSKLNEFEHVFGKKAVAGIGKILMVTNPNIQR